MTARRFLFVLWEGGGTVPPELAIASRLVARGHDVRVLADPSVEADARAAGASFVAYRGAPHRATRTPETEIIRDWAAATPLGGRPDRVLGHAGPGGRAFRTDGAGGAVGD